MDVIANNLANVSTNGFKRQRAVFEDLLLSNHSPAGGAVFRTNHLTLRITNRHGGTYSSH
ncbi:flagellar basal body protein [Escherichia coli]